MILVKVGMRGERPVVGMILKIISKDERESTHIYFHSPNIQGCRKELAWLLQASVNCVTLNNLSEPCLALHESKKLYFESSYLGTTNAHILCGC